LTWLGRAGDARWSNPANWEGHVVPGPRDVVRLAPGSPDARVDPDFAGVVAGIVLEEGYTGTVHLERELTVAGDLSMAGGTLRGRDAAFRIQGAATVRGGELTTPSAVMRVRALDIRAPGIVRMGANGKLELSGEGTPLTGDGVLDTLTHRPNSVEYTGHATTDLLTAGPAAAFRALGASDRAPLQNPAGRGTGRGSSAVPDAAASASAWTYSTLKLAQGEDWLVSAVVDGAGQYAYLGTDTIPGIVVKVQLSDMSRVGAVTLNAGEDYLLSAVLDGAGGYACFATFTSPSSFE
jgi:hypothetical protein